MEKEAMAEKSEKAWEEGIKKRRSVIDQMMAEMGEEKENLKQQAKENRWREEKDQTGWSGKTFTEEQEWIESRRGSVDHIEMVTLEKLKNRSEFLIEQLGVQMSSFRSNCVKK